MRSAFGRRERVSVNAESVWLLLHRMQKMAKCERFNISLKNHKTNYKLTLLLRWLVCFLNLVMRFAVSPCTLAYMRTVSVSAQWARENVAARETFATNGKDKRNICGQRGIARRPETAAAETYSSFSSIFSETRKEAIEGFIEFGSWCASAIVNRPHFKFPHRKYRIVSGLVHFWKMASARRNSKRLLLSIREFTGDSQRYTPLCVLTSILLA